jgi:hypothetical protein
MVRHLRRVVKLADEKVRIKLTALSRSARIDVKANDVFFI